MSALAAGIDIGGSGTNLDLNRLEEVELPPFRSAFEAGAELLMMGHYLVPSITGSSEVPISASERGIDGFARAQMGFTGLVITDALDMGALDQGPAEVVEIITMMRCGTDLLLCMPDPSLQERARVAVERGASRDLATGKPVVIVALRTPYDLARYPEARTHLCTYSGRQPSLTTLAGYLFNGTDDFGTLPVTIPGHYPRGHGLKI